MKLIPVHHDFWTPPRPRTRTERIVIHHAASAGDISAAEIHRDHKFRQREDRSFIFLGIMYNVVIRYNGDCEIGRPLDAVGGHAGKANADSVGVCIAGNLDLRPPTPEQMASAVILTDYLEQRYNKRLEAVGHYQVANTKCPGQYFPWDWYRNQIAPFRPPTVGRRVRVTFRGGLLESGGLLIGGQTYVPVRFMSEQLGRNVHWDTAAIKDGVAHVR